MQCPICNVDLVMSERQGVEIDYCPKCRGVWLDRGELDKIIERSGSGSTPGMNIGYQQKYGRSSHEDYDKNDYQQKNEHNSNRDVYPKKRKKESFLADIFDFGD